MALSNFNIPSRNEMVCLHTSYRLRIRMAGCVPLKCKCLTFVVQSECQAWMIIGRNKTKANMSSCKNCFGGVKKIILISIGNGKRKNSNSLIFKPGRTSE